MQNNEDPIDELLRRKLNERVFEPGENDWAQAEKLLDEAMPVKRKKRPGAWWYVMLLSTAIVTGYLLTKPASNKENNGTTTDVSTLSKSNAESTPDNTDQSNFSHKSDSQNKHALNNEKNEAGNALTGIPSPNATKKVNTKQQVRNAEVYSPKPALNLLGKSSNYLPVPATGKDGEALVSETAGQKNISDNKVNLPEAIKPSGSGIKQTDTVEVITVIEDSTLKVEEQVASKKDSAVVSKPETNLDGDKGAEKEKWIIAMNGGSALWKGYRKDAGDSIKSNNEVDFYAGISFQYKANEKLSISTGITYMQHSRVYQVNQFSQTRYGLSSEVESYRLLTNKLVFLQIPVEAVFSIRPSHRLTAGLALDFVLDSRNSVTYSYRNSLSSINTTNNTTSSGYRKGISDYGYAMLLGYRVQLSSFLSLSLTAQLGLRDMTVNEYYHKTYSDKNSGLRIGVIYSLYKF